MEANENNLKPTHSFHYISNTVLKESINKINPSFNYLSSTLKAIPIINIDNNTMNKNAVDAINSPINQSPLDSPRESNFDINEWKKASVADKIKRSFVKLTKMQGSMVENGYEDVDVKDKDDIDKDDALSNLNEDDELKDEQNISYKTRVKFADYEYLVTGHIHEDEFFEENELSKSVISITPSQVLNNKVQEYLSKIPDS